ncbi:hypothetical protein [Geobacter sp. AOG1]
MGRPGYWFRANSASEWVSGLSTTTYRSS